MTPEQIQISIHALREEGDLSSGSGGVWAAVFLSTPSARRATTEVCEHWVIIAISIHALREEGDLPELGSDRRRNDFYPRPPRGGRQSVSTAVLTGRNFYPRPPRGGRLLFECSRSNSLSFLSTPSARRATPASSSLIATISNFYPRPPRGGRRWTQRSAP